MASRFRTALQNKTVCPETLIDASLILHLSAHGPKINQGSSSFKESTDS